MSDELSLGGGSIPEPWGYPSPVYLDGRYQSGGIVWHGQEPATDADVANLKEALGDDVTIDQGSLVGTADPAYTTFYKANDNTLRVTL